MNKVSEVISTLLQELKDICVANDIEYILYGSTAAKAVVLGESNLPYAHMCIKSHDLRKFIDAVNNSNLPNRKVEYMAVEPTIKGFYVRYSDTSTTSISLAQNKNYYFGGIHVDILVARQRIPNELKRTALNILEHGWEGRFPFFAHIADKKYQVATIGVTSVCALIGKQKTGKIIFDKLCDAYEQHYDTKYFVKPYNKGIIEFDESPFDAVADVQLFENDYKVPEKITKFLNSTYSIYWKKAVEKPISNINRILSTEVPYLEMLEELKKSGLVYKNVAKKLNVRDAKFRVITKYTAKKNEVKRIAGVTKDRVALSEYYADKMPAIRKMYEGKDYVNLNKMMAKHRRRMVSYLEKGYGFAVNKELFDIQMAILAFEGKKQIVQKLINITPKQYMKDIFEVDNERK